MKEASFTYQMEIPVTIICSRREDGSVSIDALDVPTEDEIYKLVDTHAKEIRAAADGKL